MQTGPSVFINTSEKYEKVIFRTVEKMGYKVYLSGVGAEATIL